MELHGRFGNAFFDKFRIGTLNDKNQDLGVENAKRVWAKNLAGMSNDRLRAALDASYDYAPSCDDFKMNCFIKATQQDFKALPAPNNQETNKDYADNVVKFVAQNEKQKRDYRAWIKPILANPSAYPDISHRYALEAMSAKAA